MTYSDLQIVNESLKTTNIKGKNYIEVNERIKAFRQLFPNGSIQTELLKCEDGMCIVKATIVNEDKYILGTGIAYEKEGSSFINATSYIENCETSAVGRALGMVGIGIDTSVASYEEVSNAIVQQDDSKPIQQKQIDLIAKLCEETGNDLPDDINDWSKGKGDRAIQKLMSKRDKK